MRRRSRAGGKSPNAHAPKAAARESRIAQVGARPRSSSAAHEEATVARLNRERDDALQQQRATADVFKVVRPRYAGPSVRSSFVSMASSCGRLPPITSLTR
jgi:hypothetical protein